MALGSWHASFLGKKSPNKFNFYSIFSSYIIRKNSILLQENDDVIQELRTLHEKEKNLLMEENNKLSAELERSIEVFEY